MLKSRKLQLPKSVYDAIEQHHERWNGSGFPKRKTEEVIKTESLILGFADAFDYETRRRSDAGESVDPHDILDHFLDNGEFNPDLIQKLRNLFPKREGQAEEPTSEEPSGETQAA